MPNTDLAPTTRTVPSATGGKAPWQADPVEHLYPGEVLPDQDPEAVLRHESR